MAKFFVLEREWLGGTSYAANELIFSYKSPGEFNQWLSGQRLPEENGLNSPNDEPTSVLLARIKVQRAAAPKAKRGRKTSF
ncbi:hypothetical protein [Pseudomonas sp. OTU750018]|uniref:hypothetical protein n=1 Tax=Pseudomonas sp. OTU750018 TaxID=2709708 RepID=UPI001420EF5A|nr:hypothetical protein [Pseudomonas sp. OTU750018]